MLRVVLPVCAVAMLGLYFLSTSITVSLGDMQASVRRIEISRDRLRMIDPKLEGITDKQGEYVVTAAYAEQNVSDTRFVGLDTVKGQILNPDKSWTKLTSTKGKFDTKLEVLVLTGDVRTVSSSGLTTQLSKAEIEMKAQRIVSDKPVTMRALNGTINAKSMDAMVKDKLIIFRGDVKVHIFKRPEKDKDKVAKKK